MAMIRQENLQSLEKHYGSQRALADALDSTPGYINQLLTNRRSIGEKAARRFEQLLKKPIGWMDQSHVTAPLSATIEGVTGKLQGQVKQPIESNASYLGGFDLWDENTTLTDDEVALPFFREIELAAGSGRAHQVIENHGLKLRFAKSTLKRKSVMPENAYCVTVSGNSMEPVLPDGTTIGIDTGNTTIKNGDIYAIDHAGELRVKMLYKQPGGGLRLRSFNSDEWPDEHYTEQECAEIKILGRMFWSATLW